MDSVNNNNNFNQGNNNENNNNLFGMRSSIFIDDHDFDSGNEGTFEINYDLDLPNLSDSSNLSNTSDSSDSSDIDSSNMETDDDQINNYTQMNNYNENYPSILNGGNLSIRYVNENARNNIGENVNNGVNDELLMIGIRILNLSNNRLVDNMDTISGNLTDAIEPDRMFNNDLVYSQDKMLAYKQMNNKRKIIHNYNVIKNEIVDNWFYEINKSQNCNEKYLFARDVSNKFIDLSIQIRCFNAKKNKISSNFNYLKFKSYVNLIVYSAENDEEYFKLSDVDKSFADNHKLLHFLFDHASKVKISALLNVINLSQEYLNFDVKLKLYSFFFNNIKSAKFYLRCYDWNSPNSEYLKNEFVLSKMMQSLPFDNNNLCNWKTKIHNFSKFIYDILTNENQLTKTRTIIIKGIFKWFFNILRICLHEEISVFNVIYLYAISDHFILNCILILYELFKMLYHDDFIKYISEVKQFKINGIINMKFDLDGMFSDGTVNLNEIMFNIYFVVLHFVGLRMTPLLSQIKNNEDILNKKRFSNNQEFYYILKDKIEFTNHVYNKNEFFINMLEDVYSLFRKYYFANNNLVKLSEIVEDFISFDTIQPKNVNYENFVIHCLENENSSSDLKYILFKFYSDKCVPNNYKQYLTILLEYIINLNKLDIQEIQKINIKVSLLDKIFNYDNLELMDHTKIQNVLCNFMSDLSYLMKEVNKNVGSVTNLKINCATFYFEIMMIIANFLYEINKKYNDFESFFRSPNIILNELSKMINQALKHSEIFNNVLGNEFNGKFEADFQILSITIIILCLRMSSDFHVYIYDNFSNDDLNINNHKKLLDSLINGILVSNTKSEFFSNFYNLTNNEDSINLFKIYFDKLDRHSKISRIDVEIPDEFLDPLSYDEIKDPVVIPESNIIMDKNVILKYLFFKEQNPFSNEKLTISDLDNYNDREDVKKTCNEFKIKLFKWKKNNL